MTDGSEKALPSSLKKITAARLARQQSVYEYRSPVTASGADPPKPEVVVFKLNARCRNREEYARHDVAEACIAVLSGGCPALDGMDVTGGHVHQPGEYLNLSHVPFRSVFTAEMALRVLEGR